MIKKVEDVKKSAWGKTYDKFESVGQTKSYLLPNKEIGISLTDTEEHVVEAAQKEICFYYDFVNLYFKEYSDINYLDIRLNAEPGKDLYLAHNPIHTSFLALIVAKLNGNKRLDELMIFYRGIIEKYNSIFLPKYNLIVNRISS